MRDMVLKHVFAKQVLADAVKPPRGVLRLSNFASLITISNFITALLGLFRIEGRALL